MPSSPGLPKEKKNSVFCERARASCWVWIVLKKPDSVAKGRGRNSGTVVLMVLLVVLLVALLVVLMVYVCVNDESVCVS